MKALILAKISPIGEKPLNLTEIPLPVLQVNQVRVKVSICGICHTELDEIEGRLRPTLPIIPGHQVVGIVDKVGPKAAKLKIDDNAYFTETRLGGTKIGMWRGYKLKGEAMYFFRRIIILLLLQILRVMIFFIM
jgi:NADPH:quinone reductase-like Zn-dependent oxidoreductase